MNAGQNLDHDASEQQGGGIGLEDIYFTLFRHKWMILGFVCAGLIVAALVPIVHPAPYVSWGEVMVPYVMERKATALAGNGAEVTPTSTPGQGAINSEVVILRSADVAIKAAQAVGPARILAKKGGGNDLEQASAVVLAGVDVDNPKGTDILIVSFKHPDKVVAQQTLDAVLTAYKKHHLEVHMGGTELDDYYKKQIEEEQGKLADTDKQLRKIKVESKIVSLDETKKAYQAEMLKWQEDLRVAQGSLAELTALHPSQAVSASLTNANADMPPTDKIEEYSATVADLAQVKKKKRELLEHGFREAYPLVQNAQTEIDNLDRQRRAMEKEFPALAGMAKAVAAPTGTNAAGVEVTDDLSMIRKLTARVTYISTVISNIEGQAAQVLDREYDIKNLETRHALLETNVFSIASLVQQSLVSKNLNAVNGMMGDVQKATPAARDMKKLRKLIGGAFAGLAGLGLTLAFLLDFVINKTIRRSADIERQLHMPVFLTIPDTTWTGKLKLPWAKPEPAAGPQVAITDGSNPEMAVVPFAGNDQMDGYLDGLKERLMTYFEVHNLNMKKPKLVAVTGCEKGAGVSTVASGLAAALSKNGDGSVLLVDMNKGQGLAKSFSKGDMTRGLTEMLLSGGHDDAKVQDNLYIATADREDDGSPAKSLPSRFNNLVPKLKASDYDYIIFDMPPVSQLSATPRLASYMDITLMVLESEKTGQQMAERASALMKAARANVAAVLNKYRPHVPARLSHEL